MKNIHLFFDLDRTLWDFEKNSKAALKHIYQAYKLSEHCPNFTEFHKKYKAVNQAYWLKLGREEIDKATLRWKRFYDTLEHFGVIDRELSDQLAQTYLTISPHQNNLFPGTIEVLEELKREGYPMHIITNGFVEVQHIKLSASKLTDYFDVVLCSESTGKSKPHPVVFQTAMREANAKPAQSVMIGDDYEVDCKGALNAGMQAIHFNFRNEKKIPKDVNQIHQLSELPGLIPWIMRNT